MGGEVLILVCIDAVLSNFRLKHLENEIEDLRNQLKELHSKLDME